MHSLNKYLLSPICVSGNVLDVTYTDMKRHNSFPMQPSRDKIQKQKYSARREQL